MNSLYLGSKLPLCDRRRSYTTHAVDWIPLKVRMKALVGDTGG